MQPQTTTSVPPIARKPRKKNKKNYKLFLMALPFVALIFIFNYIPLFGWVYAFYNYKPGIPLAHSTFQGLYYFKLFFTDPDIIRVLRNTLILSFLGILTSPLPVVLAILLSEIKMRWFKKMVQTTTTLPFFVSWIIVFSLAFSIFSNEGLLNQLLLGLHFVERPTNLLGNADAVWWFQTALVVWKNLGWSCIIYIAAITGIDDELYQAATMDGAGRLKSIIHITIPGIMPTFLVILLLSVSNILSVGLEQYLVFYNSLVAEKIEVIDYYVYKLGIAANDYSYATAVGIFKSVVSITLLFSVNYISKKVRGTSIV